MKLTPKAGRNRIKRVVQASNTSPFPNRQQELLLKAALMDEETALPAWEQWRSTVDFELDVDHGSQRLLPLVYRNLRSLNYTDELVSGRIKGIYRRYWLENQKLFYKTGLVLDRLHNAGIETVVLKGMALTELVYHNYGVRPMFDADILVPFEKARLAVKVLKKAGFTLKTGRLSEKMEFGKSIPFVDPESIEIDLHWHVMLYTDANDTTLNFWDHTQPIEIAAIKTHTLSATDNLFHTLVHGVGRNPESPIRWVSDAVTLLNNNHQSVDWQRLLGFSGKLGVFMQVKHALLYLERSFNVTIPAFVTGRLMSYKPSYIERVTFRYAMQVGGAGPDSGLNKRLFAFYARYLSRAKSRGFLQVHFGLFNYTVKRLKARLMAGSLNS